MFGCSSQEIHVPGYFLEAEEMNNEEKKEIRYFSMFTGVGGFELGLERASNFKSKIQEHETEQDSPNISGNELERTTFSCVGLERANNLEETQSQRDKKSWTDSANINRELSTQRRGESSPSFIPIGFSEIDKYAIRLLQGKFSEVKNYGDASRINPSELPDFDMLCGGFPCQAFSIAGKRRGFEDTRGTLFFDIARILEVKKPKIVLLENVKGLLNHNKGETFRVIIQTLSELGYNVQWMVLNSKFFGVPQNRERVFIIGSLGGTSRPEILPFRGSNGKTKELVYTQKSDREIARIYDPDGIAPCLHLKTGGWQEPKIAMTQVHNMQPRSPNRPSLKYSSGGSGHLQRADTSYCLDGGNTNAVEFNNMKIRRLTPIECERLQGFPDNWTEGFSDTQRYKMMGNAVTVNVVKAIGEKLCQN